MKWTPAVREQLVREMVTQHEARLRELNYPHAVAWELREAMYAYVARWRFHEKPMRFI